jgi:hypothetical protein
MDISSDVQLSCALQQAERVKVQQSSHSRPHWVAVAGDRVAVANPAACLQAFLRHHVTRVLQERAKAMPHWKEWCNCLQIVAKEIHVVLMIPRRAHGLLGRGIWRLARMLGSFVRMSQCSAAFRSSRKIEKGVKSREEGEIVLSEGARQEQEDKSTYKF